MVSEEVSPNAYFPDLNPAKNKFNSRFVTPIAANGERAEIDVMVVLRYAKLDTTHTANATP